MKALIVLLVALTTVTAHAAPRRFAVVVGANHGGTGRSVLRFAESDAQKIYATLTEVTGVDYDDAIFLRSPRPSEISDAFVRMKERIAAHKKASKDPAMFVFYYSGHSDGVALELNEDRFSNDALQKAIAATDADLRLAVMDACHAGALVQTKGAKPAGYVMNVSEAPALKGQITLSASSASELALESKEVGGSYFTHHLVSGLRGAADTSQDGRVTLSELYPYTYQQTLKATSKTTVGAQHPGFDMKLKGNGEVVLSDLRQATSTIVLGEGLSNVLVIDRKTDAVIAEVSAQKKLSVTPGAYLLRMQRDGAVSEARVNVGAKETKKIDAPAFKEVEGQVVASRGEVVAVEVKVGGLVGQTIEPPKMTETKIDVTPRVVVVPGKVSPRTWYIAASTGVQASWTNTMPVIVPVRLAFERGEASAFSLVATVMTNTGLNFRETWGTLMSGYGFGIKKSFFTFRGSLFGGLGFASQRISQYTADQFVNDVAVGVPARQYDQTAIVLSNELSFLFRFHVHSHVAVDASFDAPLQVVFAGPIYTYFMPQGRVGLSFKL
ncbi:MAG: caspase family protein [Deltaproteobacteria bacterium]|nr:caspase family protein [Deltaproteobacteria bacterium]